MNKIKDMALEFKLWKSRPMLILCLVFTAGLALCFKLNLSIYIIAPVLLLLLAGAVYLHAKNFNISYIVCLLFFMTGWLCGILSLPEWRNDRSLPGPMDGFGGTIKYIDDIKDNSIDVVMDAVYSASGDARTQTAGRVFVTVFGEDGRALSSEFIKGAHIFFNGYLELPEAAQGYGMFSAENHYLKFNIRYTSYVHYADAKVLAPGSPGLLYRAANSIKQYIVSVPNEFVGEDEGGMLAAVMTGNRDYLSYDIGAMFAQLGLAHVLAASGFHIVVLLAAWQMLAKKTRIGFVPESIVSVLLIIMFVAAAGLRASITRAVVMWACVLLSKSASRQYDGLNVLGFAAFLLLLINPLWILDVGFILSFLSVAGLLLLAEQLSPYLGKFRKSRLFQLMLATVCVMLFTWPVNAYLFNYLPVLAPVNNVIFVPALSVVLAVGFILTALSAVPFMASIFGWLAKWFISIILMAMKTMLKINPVLTIRSPAVIVIALAIAAVLIFSNKIFTGRIKARTMLAGVLFALSILLSCYFPRQAYFQRVYAGYSCNYILIHNQAGVTAVINEYDGALAQSIRNLGFAGIDNLVFCGNDAGDLEYMLENIPFGAENIFAPHTVAQELGNPMVFTVEDGGAVDAGTFISIEPFKAKSADAKIHYAACFHLGDQKAVYLDPMSLREGSFEDCGIIISSRWSKARAGNIAPRTPELLVMNDSSGILIDITTVLAQRGAGIYNTNRGVVELPPAD